MDLGDLFGAVASAASGGLFGFLGSVAGGVFKYLHARDEREFEKEKWSYEKDMLALEMQARAQEAENELAIVAQQGSWGSLQASHRAEGAILTQAPGWAIGVRALFRPVLTTGLIVVTTTIFVMLLAALNDKEGMLVAILTPDQIVQMLQYIVYGVVFGTMTAITWWFGDRAFAPPGLKNR